MPQDPYMVSEQWLPLIYTQTQTLAILSSSPFFQREHVLYNTFGFGEIRVVLQREEEHHI